MNINPAKTASPMQTRRAAAYAMPRKLMLRRIAPWGLPIAILVGFASGFSLLVITLLLAIPFVVVAFTQPRIALLAIFALIPCGQSIHGLPIHLSISELFLAIFFPIALLKSAQMGKPLRMGPLYWPIMAYLFFCFISSLPHFHPHSPAITAYAQMVVYMVFGVMLCASFPGDTDDLKFALEGAVYVTAMYAFIGVITHFHILKDQKNYWGAFLGSAFVMALEFWLAAKSAGDRKKARLLFWALIVIGAALFLCLSRGGWLEAMAGSFVLLLLRKRFGLMLRVGLIVVPLAGLLYLTLPKEKQHYAFDFKSNARNIDARYKSIDYAWAQFNSNPVFGVGVQLRKEMDATDLFMVTLAESGVQGVLAFLLIHAVAAGMAWKIHKRLDPRDPRFSLVAIGAALVFQRFAHGMVDQYWCRGPLIWAWCAAGMMTAVWFEVRRRPQRAHEVNRKDA